MTPLMDCRILSEVLRNWTAPAIPVTLDFGQIRGNLEATE